jgi:hypothetical protein
MYATVNIPGSSHFDYYGPASKTECQEWLSWKLEQHKAIHEGAWTGTYLPDEIISNKRALSWRYQDGTRVITPPWEYNLAGNYPLTLEELKQDERNWIEEIRPRPVSLHSADYE